jgi:hypothetical protein
MSARSKSTEMDAAATSPLSAKDAVHCVGPFLPISRHRQISSLVCFVSWRCEPQRHVMMPSSWVADLRHPPLFPSLFPCIFPTLVRTSFHIPYSILVCHFSPQVPVFDYHDASEFLSQDAKK